MNQDDFVYLVILLLSICFGYYYKNIKSTNAKKIIGSLVGVIIIWIVSGWHTQHILICFIINAFIIKHFEKKHIYSFIFTFSYLFLLRTIHFIGFPSISNHTNLIQMIMTLKIVGLAFELKNYENTSKESSQDITNTLDYLNMFYYTFNYVGILTGPYYKYQTFHDSIYKPYYKYADINGTLFSKLSSLPIFIVMFFVLNIYWPISLALIDDFYSSTSIWYRLWYTVPAIYWYRSRIYIGMILSECVCITAGIGAYPEISEPKPGAGPTKKQIFDKLKNEKSLKTLKYNFNAIWNVRPYETETCLTVRDSMHHWNMCVQYWLVVVVYKEFPSKKFRTIATLFVSAFWHGIHIGYYVCMLGVPLEYLPLEDLFVKLFKFEKTTTLKSKLSNFSLWLLKTLTFAYFGFAFQLLTLTNVLKFFNSIYYFGTIVHVCLYFLGKFYQIKFNNLNI